MRHTYYIQDAWDLAEESASQMRDMFMGMVDPFHDVGKCGTCNRARRDGAQVDEWHQPDRN